MKELLSYQYQAYRRSNKYIMPLITYLFYLGASYQVRPLSIVASLVLSFGTLYFIMVWIGFSYGEVIDPVEEQLLLLKIRSAARYYRSKVVVCIPL
ncbi:MAG: transport system permease protein [Herbinix sp.]|nr:transport system permease protein [Herbinix sp.]